MLVEQMNDLIISKSENNPFIFLFCLKNYLLNRGNLVFNLI